MTSRNAGHLGVGSGWTRKAGRLLVGGGLDGGCADGEHFLCLAVLVTEEPASASRCSWRSSSAPAMNLTFRRVRVVVGPQILGGLTDRRAVACEELTVDVEGSGRWRFATVVGHRRTAPAGGPTGAVRACASTCRTAPARREIRQRLRRIRAETMTLLRLGAPASRLLCDGEVFPGSDGGWLLRCWSQIDRF
jgi:hypothetical protein